MIVYMTEEWADIEGYEGLYQVSSLGRVKSLSNDKKRKEKILKAFNNRKGYLKVMLSKNSKRKKYLIHRLVAQAFIDNPDNLPCINHKDENKENNCVDNLEWCTVRYNINYGLHNFKSASNRSIPIIQLTLNNEFIRCYRSSMDAEGRTGFCQGGINSCCRGKCKTCYGYKWLYATDYKGRYEVPLF